MFLRKHPEVSQLSTGSFKHLIQRLCTFFISKPTFIITGRRHRKRPVELAVLAMSKLGRQAGLVVVAQREGDGEILVEGGDELRIHLKHVQQVLARDLVQVAVGDGAHVAVRLADRGVHQRVLAEDVVFA